MLWVFFSEGRMGTAREGVGNMLPGEVSTPFPPRLQDSWNSGTRFLLGDNVWARERGWGGRAAGKGLSEEVSWWRRGGEKRLWARAWRADREPLWGVGRKAPLQPAGLPEEVTPSLPAQSPSSPRPGHGQGRPSTKSKLTPPTTPESAPASGVHRPSPNQAPGERLGRQSDQAGQ